MVKHSINRGGATEKNSDNDSDTDGSENQTDSGPSEAEKRRDLRKSVVGRALLKRDRELRDRRGDR